MITVPIPLLGGPGDGAIVQVTGQPLPGFVLWQRQADQEEPVVRQFQFSPAAAAYVLDRRSLRYVWRPTRTA